MTLQPGYGTDQLHLGQPSSVALELFGEPSSKRDSGSFRQYWVYSDQGMELIVSRRSNRILSILVSQKSLFGDDGLIGSPLATIVARFGTADQSGGGFEVDPSRYFGRWLSYEAGIAFHLDREERVRTVVISSAKKRSGKRTSTRHVVTSKQRIAAFRLN